MSLKSVNGVHKNLIDNTMEIINLTIGNLQNRRIEVADAARRKRSDGCWLSVGKGLMDVG